MKEAKKIDWRKLGKKAFEECVKKSIEWTILLLILGAAYKVYFVAIPAVTFGAFIAKLTKISLLD